MRGDSTGRWEVIDYVFIVWIGLCLIQVGIATTNLIMGAKSPFRGNGQVIQRGPIVVPTGKGVIIIPQPPLILPKDEEQK